MIQTTDSSYKTRFASFIKTWFRRNTVQEYKLETDDLSSQQDVEHFRNLIMKAIFTECDDLHNLLTQLGGLFLGLSNNGRLRFFQILALEFNADHNEVTDVCNKWLFNRPNSDAGEVLSATEVVESLTKLQEVVQPKFSALIQKFATITSGIKLLIDMRWSAIILADQNGEIRPVLRQLTDILSLLLEPSFLEIKHITWEAPASILEKLIEYEALHKIYSWNDLYQRLSSNKSCFALFHSSIPEEPITFAEIAITSSSLPLQNLDLLLSGSGAHGGDEGDTSSVVYSVYTAQKGLIGINLGQATVAKSLSEIVKKNPAVKKFYAIAPATGFCAWLDMNSNILLNIFKSNKAIVKIQEASCDGNWLDGLKKLTKDKNFLHSQASGDIIPSALTAICAYYCINILLKGDLYMDCAAKIHHSGNAKIISVNWMSSNSKKSIEDCLGITLTFVYESLPSIKSVSDCREPSYHKDVASKMKSFIK